MTKLVKTLMLAAAIGLMIPTQGEAQSFREWFVCGGNHFDTCAAVQVSVMADNSVRLRMWNMAGFDGTYEGTVFTKIGFFNTGGSSVTSDGITDMYGGLEPGGETWEAADPNNAGGISLEVVASSSDNSSIGNGLANQCGADAGLLPGGSNEFWMNPCFDGTFSEAGWVTLEFNIEGEWDLASSELLIQGQNGPDELSTQCITGDNCFTVPEPLTVALLGTGLLGLGIVVMRRRRFMEFDDIF